jgi:hypothetical protein
VIIPEFPLGIGGPIIAIILDEDIYPRKGVDHRRVGIFAENIRDGFKFDPIEVEHAPGQDYREIGPGSDIASYLLPWLSKS